MLFQIYREVQALRGRTVLEEPRKRPTGRRVMNTH